MSAVISPCGRYRYVLERELGPGPRTPCLFIMLNPSTADAEEDDATIRKCKKIAEHHGKNRLIVVNLFAFRSRWPADLALADLNGEAIGPENDLHIEEQVTRVRSLGGLVIAAWGSFGYAHIEARAKVVREKFGPFKSVGLSMFGHPKHPLFQKTTNPLVEFA